MAKAIKEQHVTYTLELTQKEALLILALTQDSFVEQEEVEDRNLRCGIFNALKDAGVSANVC